MDLFDTVKDGIVRAGREAARVRFIGEIQARLVSLRLARRSRLPRSKKEHFAGIGRGYVQHRAT